jgi:hypothetical protein
MTLSSDASRVLPYRRAVFMSYSKDRPELERRLHQARRMADTSLDVLTKERIEKLISDLEEMLTPSK